MAGTDTSAIDGAFAALAVVLALLFMAAGVSVWFGTGNPGNWPESVWLGTGLSAGTLILLGARLSGRLPILGAIVVFSVAIPVSVLFAWAILPPVLVALILLLWLRARWLEFKRE